MTGSSISFTPPPCATKGGWFASSSDTLTTPTGDAGSVSSCGSFCQSLYSPLPTGFPGALPGDGGAQPQAICMVGQTAAKQYSNAVASLVLAYSGTVAPGPSTTSWPTAALIDASQYSGVQFWLWVSTDTVDSLNAGFTTWAVDKWGTPGDVPDGGCDPKGTGATACSAAIAGVHGSTAAVSQGSGDLLGTDGGAPTALVAGWQQLRVPWANFKLNPYYGGGVEQSVDPTALDGLGFAVQQQATPDPDAGDAGDPALPFNYCVTDVEFYQ
jgi:hypothetical protein